MGRREMKKEETYSYWRLVRYKEYTLLTHCTHQKGTAETNKDVFNICTRISCICMWQNRPEQPYNSGERWDKLVNSFSFSLDHGASVQFRLASKADFFI